MSDWVPASTECPNWASFSDDAMCLAGASTNTTGPGVLLRGGWFFSGSTAGPLAVFGSFHALRAIDFVGFRCAR